MRVLRKVIVAYRSTSKKSALRNGVTAVAMGDIDPDGKTDVWYGYSSESRVYLRSAQTFVDKRYYRFVTGSLSVVGRPYPQQAPCSPQ